MSGTSNTTVLLFSVLIWISVLSSDIVKLGDNRWEMASNMHNYYREQPFLNENTCLNCHANLMEQKRKHAPAKEDCAKCHTGIGNEHPTKGTAGFSFTQEMPALCYSCHNDVKEDIEKLPVVHKAVFNEKTCANCHSPHASSEKLFLIKNEKELCLSCHNRTYSTNSGKVRNIKLLLKKSSNKHMPVEESCSNCHRAHASEYNSLLNKKMPEGEYAFASKENFALCFNCHNSELIENSLSDTLTNFSNGNENLHFVHIQGRKGRNCKICHNVHASENKYLINTTASYGNLEMNMNFVSTENGGSCVNACHAEKKYDRVNKYINNPDFNIVSIKKYVDYVDELENTDEKENPEKELENKIKEEEEVLAESKMKVEEQLVTDSIIKEEKTEDKVKMKSETTEVNETVKVEKKDDEASTKLETTIENTTAKEKEITVDQSNTKKVLKDTCVLNGLTFRILEFKSGRNLNATIINGEIEIISEGVQFFKYRVIYYIFSSMNDENMPVIRNVDGKISYPVLQVLKNAQVGEQYIFEEIVVIDPSGIELSNEVRSILIERID